MSDRTSVTFIRVSSRLEASRSPVDGMWRAYGLIVDPNLDREGYEDHLEAGWPLPFRWVTLGVARKAKDALQAASGYLPKPKKKAAPRPA